MTGYDADALSLTLADTPHRYQFHLSGGHNALNLTAALAVIGQLVPQIDASKLAQAILTLEPAFGRGEVLSLPRGGTLTLQLVKNPGGFTQALRMLELKEYRLIGIAINDDYPDGRDVSWLWDVSFEVIESKVLCGGTRAADMANRLKYDGVAVADAIPDLVKYQRAFDATAERSGGEAILFCTYTAMLKLREIYIGASGGLDKV